MEIFQPFHVLVSSQVRACLAFFLQRWRASCACLCLGLILPFLALQSSILQTSPGATRDGFKLAAPGNAGTTTDTTIAYGSKSLSPSQHPTSEEERTHTINSELKEARHARAPDANASFLHQSAEPPVYMPALVVAGRKERTPAPQHRARFCDMSVGKWVQDASHPLYQSCPFVDEAFSCQENGRPDADYLKWRWQPKDCDIPRFDAMNFMKMLRSKRVVFAGDSLMRNQWESMLCLLRESLTNKSRMFETHGHRITKGKGAYVFKFLDFNMKLEFYRSHFLVAEGKLAKPGSGRSRLTLRLDTIDRTAKKWRQADILVFTTGHWWTHGKTAKGKDYFQEGNTLYKALPVMVAFKKALTTWAAWIDKNVDPKLTKVFFCGYSPAHFDGGQWNSGGQCHEERYPIVNESHIPTYPDKMLVVEDVIRQMKTPVRLINITRLSEFRKDAHPSIYGQVPQPGVPGARARQDCSHWCLPGLPDIWNEVIYASLL